MSNIDKEQSLDQDRLDAEQEQIARLLRFAGPRLAVPDERAMRVKAAVHVEWEDSIRARQRRRAYLWAGTGLAAAAVLALAVGLTLRFAPDAPLAPPQLVATLEAATGSVRHLQSVDAAGDPGARLAPGDTVFSGTAVRTEPGTRAALRLAGGPSLRLGYGTLVRFTSPSDLILETGRIYIDAGAPGESESSISVRTPFGLVEDIGTQFEVDIRDQGIKVRVREGLVTLDHEDRVFEAPAGVELTMDDDGDLTRGPVPIFGPQWDWILEIAPPFELEGSRLETFLGWVARETGWEMHYADSELQRATAGTILHGSIAGLRPDQALEAVLPTCGLVFREEGGTVTIAAGLL
jgi:ferric-dicitrate binding protein FerR (iron transport regulator)